MRSSSRPRARPAPWTYLVILCAVGVLLIGLGLWLQSESGGEQPHEQEEPTQGVVEKKTDSQDFARSALILISVGGSVLATALCTIMYHLMTQHALEDKQRLKNLYEAGFVTVYPKRELTDYYEQLIRASETGVDVLGWSLRNFHDSHARILQSKAKTLTGFKVRLLVVDPESEEAKLRIDAEGEGTAYYSECLATLKKLATEYPKSIQLKKLKPSVRLPLMVFRIDGTLFAGPYLHGQRSNLAPTYEFREGGWLFTTYFKQFDDLWDNHSVPA